MQPQRKDETPNRDGGESRKNALDGIWSNPKCRTTGNQQLSLEQRKVQRPSLMRVGASASKWWASLSDDDMVWTDAKVSETLLGQRANNNYLEGGECMKDLTGQKFGMLTVVQRVEDHVYKNGRHDIVYECKCDCGNNKDVLAVHLRSGHTQSCGCYRAKNTSEMRYKHGGRDTRLYCIWKNMKARCLNAMHDDYSLYGGRGITICDEWICDYKSFADWANGCGYTDALTLDRMDVNGNYCPENCRWVTQKEQCNNTRRNIFVEIDGNTHTLKEWCEKLSLNYGTVSSRVRRGWSPQDAILK